jgi:hypothetical protein
MPRQITMAEGTRIAGRASTEIEAWLREWPGTLNVENVEGDPDCQARDVDLLWATGPRDYTIEIKADRWHATGNFFFETLSNKSKNTPGCFLYTQADFLFYYFVEPRRLYILPMPRTRAWFLQQAGRFEERETTTPAGAGGYTTVGRLVPVEIVLKEVPGVKIKLL